MQPNGSRHVFTLPLPRLLAGEHGHECLECERVAPKPLVQLELLGLRNEARYARAIRAHLEANGGAANDRRLILDAKGQPCSLWLP